MIGVDNITAMVEDSIAVRCSGGKSVMRNRNNIKAPRVLWGGAKRYWVETPISQPGIYSPPGAPPPKRSWGFCISGQPSRRTQSWGRKLPARQKRLNRWPPFTAGAIKTELVDSTGLVSACQGWQPMRTVAQRWTKDSKGR